MSGRFVEDMSLRRLQEMSWRFVEDMSLRRLEDIMEQTKYLLGISVSKKYFTNLYLTILRLPRCLEDVLKISCNASWIRLQDAFKTSWKTKNFYTGDVVKTSLRHVFKTSWRCLEDMSWRHYGDKKTLTGDICM